MRNRAGTSNINRRKMVRNVTAKDKPVSVSTRTTNVTSQPSQPTQKTVQGSNTVASQGIAVAGPKAYSQGGSPRSSNLIGGEIKTDEQGRMDLSEIEKMDPLTAGARGTVVPTEQMVGIVKDVAYGVESQNQATMESGLDLLINPLIKPFTDPSLREKKVITSDWYFPEELKSNWKVLPEFMQKGGEGKPPETRSFVEGMSGVVGNVGAILQSPEAGKIVADEFAVSGERFNRSSGTQAYYIGSALGEIPYFLIGAGQVKAVGTISAKATAGVVRGGLKGPTGARVIAAAYKIERATDKLSSASNRANSLNVINKITTKKEVLKAVKLLKDGYAKNTAVQKKSIDSSDSVLYDSATSSAEKIRIESVNFETRLRIASNKSKSLDLNRFGNEAIKKIEDLPETSEAQIYYKKIKVDRFNASVQELLLPDMRKFKDGYLAQAGKAAKGSRSERLASFIEGSPGNISNKIDDYFNRKVSDKGDTDVLDRNLDKVFEERHRVALENNNRSGKYAGIMGNIKFNHDLRGNTLKTVLGISRAESKMGEYAAIISRTIPSMRVVSKADYLEANANIRKSIADIKLDNKEIKKKGDSKDLPMIKQNEDQIKVLTETLAANKKSKLKSLSYDTGTGKVDNSKLAKKKPDDTRYVYDYEILAKAYPALAEDIIPEKILFGARPSVQIRKKHGIVMGQIGDNTETSKTFWFTDMARDSASSLYEKSNISKNPSWLRKVGVRKVGRYKTFVPKKTQPMEKIIHFYETTDVIRPTSGKKSGVQNIVSFDSMATKHEIALIKKKYALEKFDGDPTITNTFGGKDRILLQYKRISLDEIRKLQTGDATKKIDGESLNTVLLNRAELEIRPDEMKPYLDKQSFDVKLEQSKLKYDYDRAVDAARQDKSLNVDDLQPALTSLTLDYKKSSGRLDNTLRLISERKNITPEDKRNLNIKVQSQSGANSRGTVISMPWQKLVNEDKMLRGRFESDMIQNNETGQKYFISGEKWFEVTDDSFTPAMVTKYKKLKQQRNELVYTGTVDEFGVAESYFLPVLQSKNNPWGLGNVDKNIGIGNDIPEGISPPKEMGMVIDDTPKTNEWAVVGRMDEAITENRIFLDNPETYKGMLKELSTKEKSILESGSTIGSKQAKVKSDLSAIDQSTPKIYGTAPDGTKEFVKKTKKQLVDENIGVVLGKFQISKLQSLSDSRAKVRELLVGEKFSFVSKQGFEPDLSTYKDRTENMIGKMTSNEDVRISGFDSPIRRLFGQSQAGEITQPRIESGIKVNPLYDQMSVAHIIDETITDSMSQNYGKGLQANKGTNYEQLLKIAERQDNVDMFKERMTELVYTKINKQKKPDAQVMKRLLEKDSPEYQRSVVDVVSTPKNELLRELGWRDKRALKKKNQKRIDKISVIDPYTDFTDVLEGVTIDTRNPGRRVVDALKSQTVRSEPELYTGQQQGDAYKPLIIRSTGEKIPQPNAFNKALRLLTSRDPRKQGSVNTITTEGVNPYIYDALKSVLNEPMIAGLVDKNKRLKSIRDILNSRGETPSERVMKIQQEQEIQYGRDGNEILRQESNTFGGGFTRYDKSPIGENADKTPFTVLERTAKIDGRTRELIGPVSSQPNIKLSSGSEVSPFAYRTTLEETKDITRASVYDALGVPLDATTSAGRKMLGKDIEQGMTASFSKQRIKQASNAFKGDVFQNLESYLGKNKDALSDPELQKNIATFNQQQLAMQKVPKKVAENISGEPRVKGYTMSEMEGKIFGAQVKPRPTVGLGQQSVATSPLTTSTATALDQQPLQREEQSIFPSVEQNPFGIQLGLPAANAQVQQGPNMFEQTIGDIQKTMGGISEGNTLISKGEKTEVKSYVLPEGISSAMSISSSMSSLTDRAQVQIQSPSLLDGLRLDGKSDYGNVMMMMKPDSILAQGIDPIQKQVISQHLKMAPFAGSKQSLMIPTGLPAAVIPARVFPIVPVVTAYNPVGAAIDRNSKKRKKKSKKTWWQTPSNWYEPYYWGGKNQEGAGYVTFTGKEPGKVKKYEKRHFGIGVNDSPFGIKGKWF